MLLRVILKNFLSFDQEAQFDMFPNPKRTSLQGHVYRKEGRPDLLKMAAIYGGNGAGKSNLLKGVSFLKMLATRRDFLDREKVSQYTFALKKNAGADPMELAIEFISSGKPYIYSVSIASEGIKSETLLLSGYGIKADTLVFRRNGREFEFSMKLSEEVKQIVGGWIERNAYASLLTINNDMPVIADPNIANAQNWFRNELRVLGVNSFLPALIALYKNNAEILQFATNVFNSIDLGIRGISVETENFDEWLSSHDPGKLPVNRLSNMDSGILSEVVDFRNTRTISIENGIRKISQIFFKQFGKDGFEKEMDIIAQSDGTVRLLSLIPALYEATMHEYTVIIDELDHSIHPHLVRELVKFFSTGNCCGQLIFTTHQTCLLDQDFIRTDEVWLVEKKEGATHIYSLNDFKIHNTINIENGYMEGRYGAIPFIGELRQDA